MKKDLTGKIIGKLKIIDFAFTKGKQNTSYWNCLCECGKRTVVKAASLGGKKATKSCGCLNKDWRKKDLTNQRFGRLLVINEYQRKYKDGKPRWNCICDCNPDRIKVVSSTALLRGQISCGCAILDGIKKTHSKGFGEISGLYFYQLKHRSKRKGFDFNITIKYIWKLFLKQNRKCALSGLEIKFEPNQKHKTERTASLDRIDNSKGYVKGNVQWVHKDVNYMKQDFSTEEFINYCNLIVKNNKI